jgi:hypothetical protein
MHRFSIGLFLSVSAGLLSCARTDSPRRHLAAAYGSYRHVDNTLLFELPDTGGYLVNGVLLDTGRLVGILHEIFDVRPSSLRAVFVRDNVKRPWSNVDVLVRKSAEAGVAIFDADSSGFPRPFRAIQTP